MIEHFCLFGICAFFRFLGKLKPANEVKQVEIVWSCEFILVLAALTNQRDVWPRIFVPDAWGRLLKGSVLSRSSQPLVRQHGVP